MLRFKPDKCSFRAEARESAKSLRAAERLNVFVEYIVRITPRAGRDFHFIRIFLGSAVLHHKTRNDLGPQIAVVARITRHCPNTFELVFVDGGHHLHHRARDSLQLRVVGELVPSVDAFGDVAIDAVQTQGGGKHSHRVHEFIDRNAFQKLDVLENLFCHLRSWLLGSSESTGQQTNRRYADDNESRLVCHDVGPFRWVGHVYYNTRTQRRNE